MVVAVAIWDVAGILVVDVPHLHRLMGADLGREPGDHRSGLLPVGGAADANRLPAAVAVASTFRVDGEHVRVPYRQPRGRGCRRGRQVHGDPGLREEVEKIAKPTKGVLTLPGLQLRPGENADGDEVDLGLAHERDVLLPDGPRPLLGVVVTPIMQVPTHKPLLPCISNLPTVASYCPRSHSPATAPNVSPRATYF